MDDDDDLTSNSSIEESSDCLANDWTLVERKRQLQFSQSSLFDLSAKSILKNRALYCDLFERTGENLFLRIPKCLRVELLKMSPAFGFGINEKARLNCQFLELLLNSEVERLTFFNLPKTHNADMKMVTDTWMAMTQKCPNLQELVCDKYFSYEKSKGLLVFFSFAMHFTNLQVLDCPFMGCDNLRLNILAKSLPQLRVLRILFGSTVTMEGIAALAQLEHLQEFLYEQINRTDEAKLEDQNYFAMCLQVLPKLWVSCSRTKIHLGNFSFPLYEYAWKAFQQLKDKVPSRLGLRQLTLCNASGMPEGVALPHLMTLTLINPQENFRLGSGLESVTELGLHGLKQQLFERILGQIGHQLLKLAVWVRDTLLLNRVFHMCPNLQEFCVSECPLVFMGIEDYKSRSADLPTMEFLTEMRFIYMTEKSINYYHEDYLAGFGGYDQDFLLIVACAPNLRVLRLSNMSLAGVDAEYFEAAMYKYPFLEELETLCFHYTWPSSLDESFSDVQSSIKTTNLVLRTMIECCPKLATYQTQDCST